MSTGNAVNQETPGTTTVTRRLGGQSLYVFSGNLFTLLVGLPLQVYVSRKLGASGLGTFSLLEGTVATVAGLLGLGLAQTAVRFIPQYLEEGDYNAIRKLIVRGSLALCAVGAAGYLVALALLASHLNVFRLPPALVVLMGAMLPLGLLTYFAQQCLRGFQEIRFLMIGSAFVQLAVKAVLTVVVFALGARLVGYAFAVVAASIAALLWLALGIIRKLRTISGLEQRASSHGRWRRFALISFATSVISLPASYLDRFLLGYFAGAGPVGVLAVAKQLQQLPAILYQMLLSVSAPMFAAAHARAAHAEREHLYALTTDWAVKAALPLIAFLFLLAKPVLALFGKPFAEQGTLAIRILLLAQLFNLTSGPNGNVAVMCGLERETFRIDVVTTIAMAILLTVLVPVFGLVGVAIAMLANSLMNNFWTLYLVKSELGIRWWDRRYLSWFFPAVSATAIGMLLWTVVHDWSAIILALALSAMYIAFAIALFAQGLHDDDKELMAHVGARLHRLPRFVGWRLPDGSL